MKYRKMSNSELNVSEICLGTMTWGEQNSESEAHQQLDLALDLGVNFIDAAEMYPVPGKEETSGRTEKYIGTWLKKSGQREKVILATKVVGPSPAMPWLRGEGNRMDKSNIHQAIEGSLERLQTDYVDLYQVHWPDRAVNAFGRRNYPWKLNAQYPGVSIQHTLEALTELVEQGKIRYIGLSNETPWGIMEYLRVAKEMGLPQIISLQNPFNLLNRTLEIGITEVLHQENIASMPYSTLAFGLLTGKYDNGQRPQNSRLTLFSEKFNARYDRPEVYATAQKYNELAQSHGLTPAQMALAWINQHPSTTSNIVGATTLEQLQENIQSIEVNLSEELLQEIDQIQVSMPNPAP